MMFDLLLFILAAMLVIIAFIASLNTLTLPRLTTNFPLTINHPPVSILIPARDESATIAATVRSWLDQAGVDFELLVLDDNSADDTARLALDAAGGDPRLRVLRGEPLPAGWKGKNFACHQLAARARGDLLVFTDADVRWEPGALAALVAELGCSRADLLTVWPTQITRTWPERLVVPLMAFAVLAYLPAPAVHHLPWPVFAAANGQCLAFRRAAYETVGGHATARGSIIEDMHFARAIKARGLRLRMADGAGLVQARMYRSWREVRDGFAKNILAGHAGSPLLLLFSTLAHWALFVLPFAWLVFALVTGGATLAPLLLFLIGLLVRALTAAATRQRILDAIFLPVSVGLMTAVALRALQWHFGAGPAWKGRTYAKP